METTMPTILTCIRARTIALAALAFAAGALTGWAAQDRALAQPPGAPQLPPGMEMAGQDEPFRIVAEDFIAAAAAGDRAKVAGMLSPTTAARTGAEGVERFLAGEVLPFFAPFKELAKSVTVTRTADVTGFAFYMYMVSRSDELRPFVIYVIEEGGARVVANVLVDRLVENRHCLKVPGGWKCPDFS
jgi:hypothetical protein